MVRMKEDEGQGRAGASRPAAAGSAAAVGRALRASTAKTATSGRGVTSVRGKAAAVPTAPAARGGGSSEGRRRRGLAADDPLAPQRTRWLSDAMGGSGALAGMLGVSASQTSRWASGAERPGAAAAPLLIDLEHVLARTRLVWAEPAATVWLTSANAHLGGARPVEVLRLQGPGPVLEALDAAAWGAAA